MMPSGRFAEWSHSITCPFGVTAYVYTMTILIYGSFMFQGWSKIITHSHMDQSEEFAPFNFFFFFATLGFI